MTLLPMAPSTSSILPGIIILLALLRFSARFLSRHKYPPGPRRLPFIENLLDVPKGFGAVEYSQWTRRYGPFSYFRVFGRHFFILNSPIDAIELFEKRSAIYSSRPHLVMAGTLCGREKYPLFLPYGKRFKETRRLMRSYMGMQNANNHWHVQEEETTKFLKRLLNSPERFMEHIKGLSAAVILKVIYGIQINDNNDRFVELADALSKITTHASKPGQWLVDSFPRLQYLPTWFPGASFKKWAQKARSESLAFTQTPFDFGKGRATSGDDTTSFVAKNLLVDSARDKESEEIIMYSAAGLYAGGTDTIIAYTSLFFLMMTIHPDIQRRAQEEIDKIIGEDRLPNMSDRNSLPFIDCVLKELHRYNPPIPLVPHAPIEDDVYNGYFVPKGSWVMANIWAMAHDPAVYPNPDKFDPDRFAQSFQPAQPDPRSLTFGFGRRICPGQLFADASVFLTISRVLWAFNIYPELNAGGMQLMPEVGFTNAHTSHPKPFKCRVVPRSSGRAAVIDELVTKL